MRKGLISFFGTGFLGMCLYSTAASSLTLPVDHDSWLKQPAPDDNFGRDKEVSISNKQTDSERAVLLFDLARVPANAEILSARLRLRVTSSDKRTVNVFRITDSWTESGVNWANTANDFDASSVHGSFRPFSDDAFVRADVTSLVQDWVCGVTPNDGVMLIATSDDEQSKYASKESSNRRHRPALKIKVGDGPSPCGECIYDLKSARDQPGVAAVMVANNRFEVRFRGANPETLYTVWNDYRNRATLQLADDYPLDEGALPRGVAPTFPTTAPVTAGLGLDPNAVITDREGNATLTLNLDYSLLKPGASPVVGVSLAMQGLNRVGGGWLRVYDEDPNDVASLQVTDSTNGLPLVQRSTAQGITIVKHPDKVSHGHTPGVGKVDHFPAFSGDFPAECLQR